MSGSYVIFYGWLVQGESAEPNSIALSIAQSRPDILVASFYASEPRFVNLSPQVRSLLHWGGTKIFSYIPINYGQRSLVSIRLEIEEHLSNGVSGIFFDEVTNFAEDLSELRFCQDLCKLTRELGGAVIMNTGVAQTGEQIMELTDILMLEHQWRAFYQRSPWMRKYPPERFMGVSSNESGAYRCLGYIVDETTIVQDMVEAWMNNIGWHYSTDKYITIPPWFDLYQPRLE